MFIKNAILFILLFPLFSSAHPGIGIVKDSKGNIYYTDLSQVWKIKNGKKVIIVPGVHTHELYIDNMDNLYGEHLEYEGGANNKFNHYLWVLKSDGILDTLVGKRQAYIQVDYSLARDPEGNEYYIKQTDSNHIFKKSKNGKERVFATGEFKGVTWLHPQKDGSLLYVSDNNIYRAEVNGGVTIAAKNIASKVPSFKFAAKNRIVWGIWQDDKKNIFVAVFSDQAIKKISSDGAIINYYKSENNWTPTHGVFVNDRLWVLEYSDKHEFRVVLVNNQGKEIKEKKYFSFSYLLLGGFCVIMLTYWFLAWRKHAQH